MSESPAQRDRGALRIAIPGLCVVLVTVLAARGLGDRSFAPAPAVALHIAVAGWIVLAAWGLGRAFGAARETRVNLLVLGVALASCWVGAELVLRFGLERHSSYMERNGARYGSPYEPSPPRPFRDYVPGSVMRADRPEFAYSRPVNSLGLCDDEIPQQKPAGEYRIIALGDSFTEGVGAEASESWVKVLDRSLARARPDRRIRTLNAGISGSDVVFEYGLLRDRLLALSPDLVIVATNNTDVFDVLMRGGPERFQADGTTRFMRVPPSWEGLYAMSYVVRSIVHDLLGFDTALLSAASRAAGEAEARATIHATLRDFAALAREHGFRLLVLIHPESWSEHLSGDYHETFAPVVDAVRGDPEIPLVDLLAIYRERQIMVDDLERYFWTIDAHYRPAGYAQMGEAVSAAILATGALDRGVHPGSGKGLEATRRPGP